MFQDMPTDKVYTPESFSQHYEELEKEESGAFGNVFKVSTCSLKKNPYVYLYFSELPVKRGH